LHNQTVTVSSGPAVTLSCLSTAAAVKPTRNNPTEHPHKIRHHNSPNHRVVKINVNFIIT
jgi:hypothetical protein